MSDNKAQSNAGQQAGTTPAKPDDAQSVLSDTSTLADTKKDAPTAGKEQGSPSTTPSAEGTSQLDSAAAFAEESKKKGWAFPTATRPTFG